MLSFEVIREYTPREFEDYVYQTYGTHVVISYDFQCHVSTRDESMKMDQLP